MPTTDPSLLAALLETRSAVLADLGDGERLLVHSDLSGTRQLYELAPGAPLRQLTDLPEPVGTAQYLPGARWAAIEVDRGGDERHQIYLLDLAAPAPVRDFGELAALTADPRYGHHLAGISPDGALIAYTSNRRNGIDFDLWLVPLSGEVPGGTDAGHRLLYDRGGWCQPSSGFSPDGRLVAVERPGPRPLDVDLLLVDVESAEVRVVLAHSDEAATVTLPAWIDGERLFVSSDVGRDHAAVVRYDLEEGSAEVFDTSGDGPSPAALAGRSPDSPAAGQGEDQSDSYPVTSRDGSTLLVVENDDGESLLELFDVESGASLGVVPLEEPGVVDGVRLVPPRLSPDGGRVYYTLSTPRLAGDVWCFDRASRETRRLTTSPAPVDPGELALAERHGLKSFDGEHLPLFLFRPQASKSDRPAHGGAAPTSDRATPTVEGAAPTADRAAPTAGEHAAPPVVVLVHGGPEGQSTLAFNPIVQGLLAEGFAVAVPNVRGSVGYGKRYASLDDTTKRLDSVRDLAAIHDWLASAGLDPDRAALWGGSYGGYMVLAGLAFQPELWAAGVDIVGISDLVTFLTNTSAYRRAHRELEYGSLVRDGDFLAEASPLRRADQMRAPLFVIHGRNDPRVPVSEAEQLTATLRERGVRCELVVYDDEGHGLARLANRLDAYPRAVAFLREVLAAG